MEEIKTEKINIDENQTVKKEQIRQIVLDTETTGKYAKKGDKIVEFGAVEMIDRVITGRTLHFYINPEMHIPDEVVKVHGITDDKVKDCPVFSQVASKIIDFIKGAEIIAHNADFDTEFLNQELEQAGFGKLWNYCLKITDSWALSQSINAKDSRHGLQALKKKYEVDIERELHGALLDSQILAEVYLKMTEGQTDFDIAEKVEKKNWKREPVVRFDSSKYNLKKASSTLDPLEQFNKIKMQLLIVKDDEKKALIKEDLKNFLIKHPEFIEVVEKKEEVKKETKPQAPIEAPPVPTPVINNNKEVVKELIPEKVIDTPKSNHVITEFKETISRSNEQNRPIRKFF